MEEKFLPQVFEHEKFGKVRVVMKDGIPWFVGKDVATALGYTKPEDAVRKHVPDKFKGVSVLETPRGKQKVVVINEAGMYKLIMRSKLESAEEFSDWVCEDVLTSIRKTGSYSVASVNPLAQAISELAAVEREKIVVERKKLAQERDDFAKAQLLRELASASGEERNLRSKLVREATKLLMGDDFFKDESYTYL